MEKKKRNQDAFRSMTRPLVVVVGVGALGSHVVQFIRNVDANIRVIDFDRVESKNVASQFHVKASVRKLKVAALKQSMTFLWGRSIETNHHRLDEQNAWELLHEADLVIDCLDNADSRSTVQDGCMEWGIPCVHGALDAAGSFGRVIWSEYFTIDAEGSEGAATCEDGEFLPFIVTTAAFIARSAQLFLGTGKRVGWSINPCGVIST